MHYYQHNIGDFDKATRHLTRIERSVYRDLLDLYYDTEQRLTPDIGALCRRIVARSNEESTAVEQVLNEFFTKTPTGWFHARCEAEIDAYRANTSQKALAGKASASAKNLKKQQALNGASTPVEHPLNSVESPLQRLATHVERPLNSVATAGNGASTNQEPVTRNQKPETKNQKPETRNRELETRNQESEEKREPLRKNEATPQTDLPPTPSLASMTPAEEIEHGANMAKFLADRLAGGATASSSPRRGLITSSTVKTLLDGFKEKST